MASTSTSGFAGHQSVPVRAAEVCLVLLGTAALTAAVVIGNQVWFNALVDVLQPAGPVGRALQFSSWLLMIGLPVAAIWPDEVGIGSRGVRQAAGEWPLIIVTTVLAAAATAVILVATGATPYSDASLFVEAVVVPITEELVFRGVLLALLVGALLVLLDRPSAVRLAILANGVTFGLAHLANAATIDPAWVVSQVVFASGLGCVCAWLAIRTRSVYPAMLVHGAVNAVVVLL